MCRQGGLGVSSLKVYDPAARRVQKLDGWRAGGFQDVALAVAPRPFVFNVSNNYAGGRGGVALALAPRPFVSNVSKSYTYGRGVEFKMWLSQRRRAHVS